MRKSITFKSTESTKAIVDAFRKAGAIVTFIAKDDENNVRLSAVELQATANA